MSPNDDPSQGWSGARPFVVERRVAESETVTSFYLVPEDGLPVPRHKPGQFLGFRLKVPGHPDPVTRTYTISSGAGAGAGYRLSIKREPSPADKPGTPPGVSSNYFHDHVPEGARLDVRAPTGEFFLHEGERPVVLLSGGVGLTPMISMLDTMVAAGDPRDVWFIHGVRNGAEHAFGSHVRALAETHDNVHAFVAYLEPRPEDVLGRDFDAEGIIAMDGLKAMLPGTDCDFYLCGPPPFMKALYNGLLDWGVAEGRIYYEFFGPATVLKEDRVAAAPAPQTKPEAPTGDAVKVTFRKSGVSVDWDPAKETLLELAEASGLVPDFSCRSGVCHTCLCTLVSGEIEYIHDDVFAPDDESEVLICSSRPKTDVILDI